MSRRAAQRACGLPRAAPPDYRLRSTRRQPRARPIASAAVPDAATRWGPTGQRPHGRGGEPMPGCIGGHCATRHGQVRLPANRRGRRLSRATGPPRACRGLGAQAGPAPTTGTPRLARCSLSNLVGRASESGRSATSDAGGLRGRILGRSGCPRRRPRDRCRNRRDRDLEIVRRPPGWAAACRVQGTMRCCIRWQLLVQSTRSTEPDGNCQVRTFSPYPPRRFSLVSVACRSRDVSKLRLE